MTDNLIVKMPGQLTPGADDSTSSTGSFDVILSTPGLDRDGEKLHTHEWKTPLPARITFDVDHGMSVEKTIGSGVPFINTDGNLQVRGVYASTPLAQMTRTLVGEGHIFATSVTFMQSSADVDGKTVTSRELLNGAFVSIPANPEALVLASKALATSTQKSSAQAIHDLAHLMGATCTHPEPVGKTVTPDPASPAAAPAPAVTPGQTTVALALAYAELAALV